MAGCLIGCRGEAPGGVCDPAAGSEFLGQCAPSGACASTVHYEVGAPVRRPELLHALCEVLLRRGFTVGIFRQSGGLSYFRGRNSHDTATTRAGMRLPPAEPTIDSQVGPTD